MTIHFIRHTSVNVPKGICYGQSDVPVSATFAEEAQLVKEKLDLIDLDLVYCSPLDRCKKLAHYCKGDQAIIYDDRLKEMDYGEWEMKDWATIDFSQWEEDWVHSRVPYGESFHDQYLRLCNFIEDLKERKDISQIAVFTHGGILACARTYFHAIPLEKAFDHKAAYGDIFTFTLSTEPA